MAVILSRRDEFALLTIDRPEALNALSSVVLDELSMAIEDAGKSGARALLVTGAGTKAFCAGADIKEIADRPRADDKRAAEHGQAIFAKLDRLPILSIAIINGIALGGGLELALACSFRVAVPGARMGLPEIKLGLIPGYGGTQRLPRLIGEARALELILSGRSIDAEEAMRIGLVNRIVEGDAVARGIAFAREMTRHGLPAISYACEAVRSAAQVSLAEGLRIEAQLSSLAYRTRDAEEGLRAFLKKRPPKFEDR